MSVVWSEMTIVGSEMSIVWSEMSVVWSEMSIVRSEMSVVWSEMSIVRSKMLIDWMLLNVPLNKLQSGACRRGLQNVSLSAPFMAFEQGGIFIVPYQTRLRTSGFFRSHQTEPPPFIHVVAFYGSQWYWCRTFTWIPMRWRDALGTCTCDYCFRTP